MAKLSALEEEFKLLVRAYDFPRPLVEMQFCPTRCWRCDFCWPDYRLIVEIEGGIYNRGRHVRYAGYKNDCEKYNEAQLLGYKVIRFVAEHLRNGYSVNILTNYFKDYKK